MQLLDLVLGAGTGSAPAVLTAEVTVSRAELRETVADLGRALSSITAPGDRIVLASDNVVETLALMIGIPAAGRIVVPLNTRGTVDDAWDLVASVSARVLVGNYVTSLDMAGCSVTLTRAEPEWLRLYDEPVNTAGLRWGA